MEKWILTINNNDEVFDKYETALSYFLKEINNHFWKYSLNNRSKDAFTVYDYNCLPDVIDISFGTLYEGRFINDTQIVLCERLKMLLDFLLCSKPKDIKDNAYKVIDKDYHYKDINTDDYDVSIDIDYSPSEIAVSLKSVAGESLLVTNVFNLDNPKGTYYLSTHQVCNTTRHPENLGKHVDFDIKLRCVDYD